MPDDPSATLSAIRERAHELTIDLPQEDHCGSVPCTGHDALRLVMLAEAVLALADKWEKEAARLDGINEGSTDPQQRAAISMRAQAFEECGRDLREAVTSALAGKE